MLGSRGEVGGCGDGTSAGRLLLYFVFVPVSGFFTTVWTAGEMRVTMLQCCYSSTVSVLATCALLLSLESFLEQLVATLGLVLGELLVRRLVPLDLGRNSVGTDVREREWEGGRT